MSHVHVCPLSLVHPTVTATRASHLISLLKDGTPVERPTSIPVERHLYLGIDDIIEPMEGMITPAEEHVQTLLDFVDTWDQRQPLVVHCFAGISRSTAAAFISLCAVRPERAEIDIAQRLRAASSIATPNILLVGLADRMLDRKGRMVTAIQSIGRGESAFENVPFSLALDGED